jgi:hypothetical protein
MDKNSLKPLRSPEELNHLLEESIYPNIRNRLQVSLFTLAVNETTDNAGIVNDIGIYWSSALEHSFPLVQQITLDLLHNHPAIELSNNLLEILVFSAAAHAFQLRRDSGNPTFWEHQYTEVALPNAEFFTNFPELGVSPEEALTVAFTHDLLEDWPRFFAGKETDRFIVTSNLTMINHSDRFQVANSFLNQFLRFDWQNELATQNQPIIDELTIPSHEKALTTDSHDQRVTDIWTDRIDLMDILPAIVKFFDLRSNRKDKEQRVFKTAQRLIVSDRLHLQIMYLLRKHALPYEHIQNKMQELVDIYSDPLTCKPLITNIEKHLVTLHKELAQFRHHLLSQYSARDRLNRSIPRNRIIQSDNSIAALEYQIGFLEESLQCLKELREYFS